MAKPLHSIPTRKYPLNWTRYSKLHDELDKAVNGFEQIGHHDLAEAVAKARRELYAAWNLIQQKERAELASADDSSAEG